MKASMDSWQAVLVGLYPWSASANLEAVLADIVYQRAFSGNRAFTDTAIIFSSAADFLLLLVAATFLTSMVAVGVSCTSHLPGTSWWQASFSLCVKS